MSKAEDSKFPRIADSDIDLSGIDTSIDLESLTDEALERIAQFMDIKSTQRNMHINRNVGLRTSVLAHMHVGNLVTPFLEAARIPEPLWMNLRERVWHDLSDLFGPNPYAVDEKRIDDLMQSYRDLMPTRDSARAANEDTGILTIGNRSYWAQGWLHELGEPMFIARREPDLIRDLTYLLDNAAHRSLPVGERTALMTKTLTMWARGRHYRYATELSLPVITPGSRYYGRNDVVMFRRSNPPIVIELDSDHNPGSQMKLEFARKAGAVPIWVRWHKGEVVKPRGVHVIDLT